MSSAPDRLSVHNHTLIDGSGRTVTLRGLIVQTSDFEGVLDFGPADYDRMAAWGMTLQQIRLDGGRLGVLDGEPDPGYEDKLERMVTWGADRGMHTWFKMTTYDVFAMVGEGGDPHGPADPKRLLRAAFNRDYWQRFWTDDSWQQNRIDVWKRVWKRFAGRPEVLGYDLVNEPAPGRDTQDVTAAFVFPFYDRAARELRTVDSEALVLVQPAVNQVWGWGEPPEGMTPNGPQVRLADPLVAYAPHYYPDMTAVVSPEQYAARLEGYLAEARTVGGPLFIGEYGQRNVEVPIEGGPTFRKWNRDDDMTKADLFDRFALTTTRCWYNDRGYLAVFDPGFVDTERIHILARPYVHRSPGPASWRYDFDDRRLVADLQVDVPAELVVSAPDRHWPGTVTATVDGRAAPSSRQGSFLTVDAGFLPTGRHQVVVTG